jgi:hypothetical protein
MRVGYLLQHQFTLRAHTQGSSKQKQDHNGGRSHQSSFSHAANQLTLRNRFGQRLLLGFAVRRNLAR